MKVLELKQNATSQKINLTKITIMMVIYNIKQKMHV